MSEARGKRARRRRLARRALRREIASLRASLAAEVQRTHDALATLETLVVEEHRAGERMTRLQAVTAGLSSAATPAQVADVVIHQGVMALDAVAGSVALLSEDGATLEMVAAVGYPAPALEPWRRFSVDTQAPMTESVRSGAPVFLESAAAWRARFPGGPRVAEHGAWAAIPLLVEGRVLGACGLSFAESRAFPEAERRFMVTLAELCAQALDRARLLEAEMRARAEAERANLAKDEFLAVLSHELRTPLTAIFGWLRILRMKPPDAATLDRALTVMERNARAEARLVEDILDVSRIVAQKLRIEIAAVDLAGVVRTSIELVSAAAEAKGVALEVALGAEPLLVRGDEARLHQVVSNVLGNAVKFTPRGGRVRVEASALGGAARVCVSDTGEGISAEFLPYVFDRFTQADAGVTRAHGGLGLGLAIAKHLVEMHEGTIAVESPGRGQGAIFTITLPLAISTSPTAWA
jgi:hypothetical protein